MELGPVEPLAAPIQPLMPEPLDLPTELPQTAIVRRPAVVLVVTSEFGVDFVNRDPAFDDLYLYQPILEACCRLIGAPFHLSTMHARAVNPGAPAQDLHASSRAVGSASSSPAPARRARCASSCKRNGKPGSFRERYGPALDAPPRTDAATAPRLLRCCTGHAATQHTAVAESPFQFTTLFRGA